MATLKVGADGKAPKNAKIGDTIVTAGGSVKITGGTAGNWTSAPVGGSSKSSGGSAPQTPTQKNYGTTITHADGTTENGYIDSAGHSYTAAGVRVGVGDVVTDNSGRTWQMTDQGGVEVKAPAQIVPEVDLLKQSTVSDPKLYDAATLGKMYGVTYDYGTINDILQKSVKSKYDTLEQDSKQNENKFYNETYNLNSQLQDTLQKAKGSEVVGASAGASKANQLLAALGYQQETSDLATVLTQDRQQLALDKGADTQAAIQQALEYANSTGLSLGSLASSLNANATQSQVGIADVLGQILTNKATNASNETMNAATLANNAAIAATQAASGGGYSGGGGGYNSNGSYTSSGGATYNTPTDALNAKDYSSYYAIMVNAGANEDVINETWRAKWKRTPSETAVEQAKRITEGMGNLPGANVSGSWWDTLMQGIDQNGGSGW